MAMALGRRLWVIVGALLVLTAVLVYISSRGSTARVAVVDVVRQSLSSVVSTNGKVEPVSPSPFRATFPTFVNQVPSVEGQQVKKGQLIFTLDDKSISADLAQARAELAEQQVALRVAKAGGRTDQVAKAAADFKKAQASLDQIGRENESLKKLVAQKAATPQELEQNQLMLTQAEADVQSLQKTKTMLEQQAQVDSERIAILVGRAQTEVRDLEEKIASARGTAPFDGTLYSLPIRKGDFVKEGDLLAEVADLHHVRVRAFIDEPELGQIEPDQPVEILWDAHPERTWTGRTEMVPKQVVTRGTRNVGELLCSVSSADLALIPNTTVDVRIHITERPNVLVVPRGAVYIEGDTRFVYRVEDGRLHRRFIKVGIANPTMIEVLSGLNQGDTVALPGDVSLKENLRIVPVRQE
jgi:HlyD family secretion protein